MTTNVKLLSKQHVLNREVNVYGDYDNPLFLAKDVAEWIEYAKTSKGAYDVSNMLKGVDEDEKLIRTIFLSGQNREVWMLTKNGVLKILSQSRKAIAKEVKREIETITSTTKLVTANLLPDNISSLEVLEQINLFRQKEKNRTKLRHDTLRDIIKDEFAEEILSQNILEKSVTSTIGRPMLVFELSLNQAKQVLLRESKYVRKAVLVYIERLEGTIKSYSVPQTLSEALLLAANQAKKIEEQNSQLLLQAPSVRFAKALEDSEDYSLVAELAKILNQEGVNIGQNRLYEWLRQNNYLCSKGSYRNQPTQRAIDMRLFRIVKSVITKPNGETKSVATTKLTSKGTAYFIKKFLCETCTLTLNPKQCE